jgi:GH24 family phage-related lysozyme (muramidase)
MPINRIRSSGRARAAIAAVIASAATAGGYVTMKFGEAPVPASVALSVDSLIMPWEGLVLRPHWDRFSNRWDICFGETKGIGPNMVKTKAECRQMLMTRVVNDYYKPLTECIDGFEDMPISVQASMISGAYNYGPRAQCNSRAAQFARDEQYRQACEAQTAFNKAGGHTVPGLVLRREMGDAQRIGEAELCVSGLN